MRGRRFALLSSFAALALAACEGNPPTRTGQTTLDFGTLEPSPFGGPPQTVWRLSKYAGSPFFHWDFRDWELKGNPVQGINEILDLPTHSLDDPKKLFMRYAVHQRDLVSLRVLGALRPARGGALCARPARALPHAARRRSR